jgi:hypothetical protein
VKEKRLLEVWVSNSGKKSQRGKTTTSYRWKGKNILVYETNDKRDYTLVDTKERINKKLCTIMTDYGTDSAQIELVLKNGIPEASSPLTDTRPVFVIPHLRFSGPVYDNEVRSNPVEDRAVVASEKISIFKKIFKFLTKET